MTLSGRATFPGMSDTTDKDLQSTATEAEEGEVVGKRLFELGALKDLREERDLSRDDLAKSAGVHPNTIGELENLKRPAYPRTAHKIARALEIDLSELRQRRS